MQKNKINVKINIVKILFKLLKMNVKKMQNIF